MGMRMWVIVALAFLGNSAAAAADSAPPAKGADAASAAVQDAFRKGEAATQRDDYVEALRWYRIAADGGHPESQNDVGMFYVMGMGGAPRDPKEGARWLRKAADAGHPAAERNLGWLYAQGVGVPQDRAQAVKWLRKAAAQGDDDAKSMLKLLKAK